VARSLWKASLCKLQEHDIAMSLGFKPLDVDKNEEFDPVNGFDFTCRTITIDTVATNMAIYNFNPSTWLA
jgi:hypothetical protein